MQGFEEYRKDFLEDTISLMVRNEDSKSVVTLAATTVSESRSASKALYFEDVSTQAENTVAKAIVPTIEMYLFITLKNRRLL